MENNLLNLLDVVEDSFATYSAMTIQDRAIVDARDCLKPSQRQCTYAQLLKKVTYKKKFEKSQFSVGAAMQLFYVHGDSACYDLMARLAKPYNMRYALEDFKGQMGTISTGKAAAARYTEMRLGELGCKLFEGLDEDAIDIWFNNYSDTEQFPSVAPSLGFYNICNGTSGIATSLSSSIPQFNLKEVNEAMIKLLWNPDIDFDEIYCPPDFCTAGTILNADKVKEILRYGGGEAVKGMKFNGKKLGSSVRMRATATYDSNENALYFTEVPYGVYVSTIIEQIVKGINEGHIIGIAQNGIKDLSKMEANLKIVLEKGANPTKMIKTLYKITDLDSSYPINMVMLDKGTQPKLFSWKEALQAHLNHEIEVRTRIHNFHVKKIDARINIIDGLLLAIANIDEVVEIIRGSDDKDEAKTKLMKRFEFNEPQVEAILKMTLSKLIHLEIGSFRNEKEKLLIERKSHIEILNSKELLFKEIEADLRNVANKFGDARKTRLTNFDFAGEEEDAEPIEKKELVIHFTNLGNIYTQEASSLVKTRRGGKGAKVKMGDNEIIVQTLADDNLGSILAFSNKGVMYSIATDDLPVNAKINVAQLFEFDLGEHITALTSISRRNEIDYFVFVTKNGMVKKTAASEYDKKRGKAIKAINLKDDDEVVSIHFIKNEKIGILTSNGNFVIIKTEDINAIGRVSMGVKGIKLSEDDFVIDSKIISGNNLITVSAAGLIKKASIDDFPDCNRGIKGKKISGTRGNDEIVKFLTLDKDCDIIIISNKGTLKFDTTELRVLSREATGVTAMKLPEGTKIVDLVKS